MKALLPFVRMLLAHRGWVCAGLLLSLLTLLAAIGLLTLSGWFISASALAGVSLLSARQFNYFTPGAGVRGFAIARTVGRYFERVTTHEATFRVLAELRSWFYRRLEVLGPARLQAYRSADLLNRLVADINALDNLYLRVLVPTLVALAVSLIVVMFVARYSPAIALLTTVALLLAGVLLPMLAQYAGRRLGRLQMLLLSRLRVRLLALVQGHADLQIYGGVDASIQKARSVERQLQRTQLRMALISGLTTAVLTIIAGVAGMGALVLGTELVLADEIAPAHLAMLLFCVLAVFEAVAPLPLAYQYLSKTVTAAERLNEVSDASADVCYPDADVQSPTLPGQIVLRDVCFRYTEHAPLALDRLSVSVVPGEHVLVLGHTGSGKSSLINLLARFYDPEAGAVELSGCSVRSYSETTLRAQMSVLSQPVQLFAGNVADNLRLALPDASPSELLEVLRRVCLDQVLGDNPLEYQIGESGGRLSGGQRKRLALARALLKPSPLLVLDEPTEGLDAVTEAAVIKGVLDSCQGRTVLMISHHLQMANHFDRIIVLDRGCVIEAGAPVELAERPDSRYNQLRAL